MSAQHNNLSRRHFVRLSGLTGVGLTLGFYFPAFGKKGTAAIVNGETAASLGIELSAWISIDKSGKVTLYNHRSEMGQGSFQSVPQIIAEELEVDLADIHIEFAPGAQGKYGSQVTGGSSTIRGSYQQLLRTSASARQMLVEAAAKKWGVALDECYASKGWVLHKNSDQKLSYGDLVEAASALTPPTQVVLKERKHYKLIGKPLPRADNAAKINGTAIFGLDKTVPGMLFAVVERNPRFHGKVKSFDATAAKAVAGVKAVFKVQMPVFGYTREGVAIVATSTWAALQARKQLKVTWDDTGFVRDSTTSIYQRMANDLTKPGNSARTAGNVALALTQADKKIEAVYQTPYQSHSCMEPINCVVHWQPDKVEVWGPIQGPDWIQSDLADRLKLKPEQVVVNMTFLGGGFGRKAFTDYTAEAAFISKEVKAPVKVVWTREDDMTQGPFRPGAMYSVKGGIKGGRINAFAFKMAAQNMDLQDSPKFDKTAFNDNVVEGFCEPYFNAIRHNSFSDIPTESPIPVMWWRSVYASTNGFAYESFVDELAIAAQKDPLEFRKAHLRNPRYQAVLNKLNEMCGWKQRAKNAGWGVAITECFGSIVGEVVKVAKASEGGVRIEKVWAVMDCGWYVNPDIIKAQIEGSIFMALGAATIHETHFADGKAVESNFSDYNMPRIGDINSIDIHIMDNEEKAGGVGEPALPPFAPALCNAIFDLTGKRIRKLPFSLQEV
jgi:isoquinoline 1-oxidoreductase subunit beta